MTTEISLTGKGRKTRSVPLMEQTVRILKEYMKKHAWDKEQKSEHPLFYNAQGKKLTRQGITYVLKKYAEQCGSDNISPHQLRHAKAMHLTEANVFQYLLEIFLLIRKFSSPIFRKLNSPPISSFLYILCSICSLGTSGFANCYLLPD